MATLANLQPEMPCPSTLQDSPPHEPLPPAICFAIDTAATNGNHRQQSPSRRHCLCGTAAKWRVKAVAVGIVGDSGSLLPARRAFDFSSGHGKPRRSKKRHTTSPFPMAKRFRRSTIGNYGNRPTSHDFLRHCLCYRLIDTAGVALRRRSAPLRSAVCSLRSPRVGRALVTILARCLGFGGLLP